jgi:hypothetical protein
MTCVPICLISWDWISDIRSIVVGVVGGGIGGALVMRWWDRVVWRKELDNRMSKIEGGLGNLDTSLSAKITSLEGTLGGKLTALESLRSIQEAHRSENQIQYESLMRTLSELRRIPDQVRAELKGHVMDCRENVIHPINERLVKLELA